MIVYYKKNILYIICSIWRRNKRRFLMNKKNTIGFWVLITLGMLILIMLLIGQMMSFISYEFTVSIGLQEPVDVVGEMGVALNKGFGVGDTIIYMPLLTMGLVGLWQKKAWGVFAMVAALGITAYWPMVILFLLLFAKGIPGFNFANYTSYTIILISFTIYGIWGLWYLYKKRKILIQE